MESPFRDPVPDGTLLIETFGFVPGQGAVRGSRHLDRMAASARVLGFAFDRDAAEARLRGIDGPVPLRCRLTLDRDGLLDLTAVPLPPSPPLWTVAISPRRLRPDDPWLAHKTTQRQVYDAARADLPPGVDEMLFLNTRGELCEGTITNLFVTMPDGRKVTPPLSCGLLPGVLRADLLDSGAVTEAVLTPDDLLRATTIEMGNSLRGLIPVTLAGTG